ncbi:MAG: PAS domain S-box protein [Candidatus Magnetominusculus sp. LBB02]|nr:PAS domain S-box protein [Candidatus Magnetominusculus sp. LBB02]
MILLPLDIINKFLVITQTLEVIPTVKAMAEFLNAALHELIGVKSIYICHEGQLYTSGNEDIPHDASLCKTSSYNGGRCSIPENYGFKVINLRTLKRNYGYMIINVLNTLEYANYEPFLRNTSNVLARILENRQITEELNNAVETLHYANLSLEVDVIAAQKKAHFGTFTYESASRQSNWSLEMYKIWGIDPILEPPVYTELANYAHPDDYQCFNDDIRASLEQYTSYDLDIRIFHPDKTEKIINIIAEPILDNAGKLVKIRGSSQDITERKKMEQELKHKNDFNLLIMENIAEGLSVSHTVEKHPYVLFTVWNNRMTEITGYILEEINTIGWHNALYTDIQQQRRAIKRMEESRAGDNLVDEIWEIISKAGQKKLVSISTSTITDTNGLIHVLAVMDDITDRKKTENELIRASHVIEQSPIMVLITNTMEEIEYVNRKFTDVTGYTLNEIKGKNPVILKSDKTPDDVCEELWIIITSGRQWRGELNIMRKDGIEILVSVKALPLHDTDGDVTHYLRLCEDITDLRHLEAELRQSQKMEAVGQLAGGIAHDFNNILSTIKNYAYLLKTSFNKEDAQLVSFIDSISSSSDKAAYLTQSLLGFSRKLMLNLRPVNLITIVAGMRTLFESFVREDINVRLLMSASEIMVYADNVQLEMILINLVNNAMDSMSEGGVLTIKADITTIDNNFIESHDYGTVGDYARICVSDTGEGMDTATTERIFEPFFTTKEVGKGTGLGLATAYGIVKQHNGYINVHSEAGIGSTFTILLPLIKSSEAPVEIIKPAAMKGQGETILLAEDNDEMRNSVSQLLRNNGYKVIEAVDGADAMLKFDEHSTDIAIVLLDVIMPRANGKVVYDHIRDAGSVVKIIFLSGYSFEIVKTQDISNRLEPYIQKPVNPDVLLGKIREVLDQW